MQLTIDTTLELGTTKHFTIQRVGGGLQQYKEWEVGCNNTKSGRWLAIVVLVPSPLPQKWLTPLKDV